MSKEVRSDEVGAAVVDFVLVSVLVLFLFLVVLQVGFVLHVRNLLVSSAAEGARYGADADRTPADGADRARASVSTALSGKVAGRLTYAATTTMVEGEPVVEVTISGPLPLVFLPAGPLSMTVHGHALQEGP